GLGSAVLSSLSGGPHRYHGQLAAGAPRSGVRFQALSVTRTVGGRARPSLDPHFGQLARRLWVSAGGGKRLANTGRRIADGLQFRTDRRGADFGTPLPAPRAGRRDSPGSGHP